VRTPLATAAALTMLLAGPAGAQTARAAPDQAGPGGQLVLSGSLAGGGEVGVSGRPGLADVEALAGWEIPASAAGTGLAIRPEVALAFGLAPRLRLAFRPGVRVALPGTPLWLRAAFDWSNARGDAAWRWLLLGVAWEVRLTGVFGLFAEADTGVPLSHLAGLPVMVRVGATFRP
jgi:hypothetical protein